MQVVNKKSNSIILFKNVVWALFIKEIKVQYSHKGYFTYFWLVGDPLLMILSLLIVYTLIMNRAGSFGMSVQLVLITGMIPYKFFSASLISSMNAIDANKALLGYRQISVFSIIASRIIFYAITNIPVFLLLYVSFFFLGYKYYIYNIYIIILSTILLMIFTYALSLMTCTLGFYFKEAQNIVQAIVTILMFLSGVIFDISIIPNPYRGYLLYNPLMQAIGLIRSGFLQYKLPDGGGVSLSYLFLSTLATLFLGLLIYLINRENFIREARARA